MKLNKRKVQIIALISVVLVVAVGAQYYQYKQKKHKEEFSFDGLAYQKLVTSEDKSPLPVETKGRYVRLPILMYHHIGEPPANAGAVRKDLTVSVKDFQDQVDWLASQNYQSITLNQLYLASLNKFTLPAKPVIFTFDDGYDDVFTNAIPILKKAGFIGSFAIITKYPKAVMGDNFYASWEEIASAYQAGNEIVSHTQDHFDGKDPKYTKDFITKNLTGSIEDIKEHLGFTTNLLIYPYGHYTPDYIKIATDVGFVMGVTVHEGDMVNLDNLMEVPRVRVHHYENVALFKKIISHSNK